MLSSFCLLILKNNISCKWYLKFHSYSAKPIAFTRIFLEFFFQCKKFMLSKFFCLGKEAAQLETCIQDNILLDFFCSFNQHHALKSLVNSVLAAHNYFHWLSNIFIFVELFFYLFRSRARWCLKLQYCFLATFEQRKHPKTTVTILQ